MDTTIENNKLIAEFVGLRKINCVRDENGKYYDFQLNDEFTLILDQEIQFESNNGWGLVSQDYVFAKDLIFHTCWSWLMLVVEKIESLGFTFEIKKNWCKITQNKALIYVRWEEDENKIQAVYNNCVDFIKWYNENK